MGVGEIQDNAGRRASRHCVSLATTAEFPASLYQGFEGTGFGLVFCAYINLNALRSFRHLAFKLFAKFFHILSATVCHMHHLLCFNILKPSNNLSKKIILAWKLQLKFSARIAGALREAYASSGRARIALGPPPASRGTAQNNSVPLFS
jgi:hypothetical protein